MSEDQKKLTRSFFSRHAHEYAQNISHAGGRDSEEVAGAFRTQVLRKSPTALALTPFVREFIGIDLTPEMAISLNS